MKIEIKIFEDIFIYYVVNESLYGVKLLYPVFPKINGYLEDRNGG